MWLCGHTFISISPCKVRHLKMPVIMIYMYFDTIIVVGKVVELHALVVKTSFVVHKALFPKFLIINVSHMKFVVLVLQVRSMCYKMCCWKCHTLNYCSCTININHRQCKYFHYHSFLSTHHNKKSTHVCCFEPWKCGFIVSKNVEISAK